VTSHLFEKSGFEAYEGREELEVERELATEVTAPAKRKLRFREIADSVKESNYAFED